MAETPVERQQAPPEEVATDMIEASTPTMEAPQPHTSEATVNTVNAHAGAPDTILECPHCAKTYKTPSWYERHVARCSPR